jgi:ABC-type lipoprotein export system ATPase subunit
VSLPTRGADVVVDHVSRSFEDGRIAALVDVTFRVEESEYAAVTGPSGCGKSTLLNLIGALDRPDTGEITVAGEQVGRADGAAYRASVVGFVFQFHNLIPTLTSSENVQLPMLGQGSSRKERSSRAADLLAEVGLSHRRSAYPPTLSGGERQRVAIARALAVRPAILLADEPTARLDHANARAVGELLARLAHETGTAVVCATHDAAVIEHADTEVRLGAPVALVIPSSTSASRRRIS